VNILFVSDVSIGAVIGGAERVLFEQTTRLAARGHDVHILTRRLSTHQSDDEVIENVHEWRYPIDDASAVSYFISTLANGKRLFESLTKKHLFDCINFHQPFSAYEVLRSARADAIRKVYTCHSLAFEEYSSRNPMPDSPVGKIKYALHRGLRKWIEGVALRRSDAIVVLSAFTKDKLLRHYGIADEKISVIPGGIDLGRFHPADDRRAIRSQLGLPPDKILLFTVRNLVRRMGLENLIVAMRDVVAAFPDIILVIGGEGPLKRKLIHLTHSLGLEKYITLTGFIPEAVLPDYYRSADVFILPTVELEGFGLVTLEALASGTPVLGTPVGGTKEILGLFNPAYLFKDTSSESIAELIIKTGELFKNNPIHWKEVSSQCRLFAQNNYSWDKNIHVLEKLFETG
jgi:glycosyltransferase involved in cell wall biosynthesis